MKTGLPPSLSFYINCYNIFMSDKKEIQVVTKEDFGVTISESGLESLRTRMAERNNDKILDLLEEIHLHREAIKSLVKEINKLAGSELIQNKSDDKDQK